MHTENTHENISTTTDP